MMSRVGGSVNSPVAASIFVVGLADEHFRLVEDARLEHDEGLAQVILRPAPRRRRRAGGSCAMADDAGGNEITLRHANRTAAPAPPYDLPLPHHLRPRTIVPTGQPVTVLPS